jgi:hypothetical protein
MGDLTRLERNEVNRQTTRANNAERGNQMLILALNDERQARQDRDGEINILRRTVHRWTMRYNNDTERWRRRHGCAVRQAQNWKDRYRDETVEHQKWHTVAQRLEGAMINNDARKQARINALVREKFALQLINRNARQNIFNLQQQILVLQNNPINQGRMVGYGPPIFYGRPGEDPEDWYKEFKRYCIANRINFTPGAGGVAGRAEIDGLFDSCIEEPALTWVRTHLKDKNWECSNISDNVGVADLNAVRTIGAGNGGNQIGGLNTAGQFQNEAGAEIGRIGAGVATGADLIPVGTFDEDWTFAGGRPTNNAPVAPNAGGGFPAVTIAPGIRIGQKFYWVLTNYTTINDQKQMAIFGQLTQGSMPIEQFVNHVKKIGKVAKMTPTQIREQVIRGLNPANQYNIRMMAKLNDTLENITEALVETEKFISTQGQTGTPSPFSIAQPSITPNYGASMQPGQGKLYTEAEIDKLLEERMASRGKYSKPSFKPKQESQYMQTDTNADAVKQLVVAMKRAKKTLAKESGPGKKKADQIHTDRFLDEVLKNMGDDPAGFDDEDDPVEEMRRQLEDLHINQTKIAKDIKKIASEPKSTTRKKKTGGKSKTKSKSTSKTKSKKKKKKKSASSKQVNSHTISDDSSDSSEASSDSSSSDNDATSSEDELETNALEEVASESSESFESESSSSSDSESEEEGGYEVNATKKKVTLSDSKGSKKRKKTSSKKSSKASPSGSRSAKKSSKDTKSLKVPTDNIILNAFFAILRSMVDSFVRAQSREVSINTWNTINAEFIGLKDPILSHYVSNFSEKEREKFWNGITIVFSQILQPMTDLVRIVPQQTSSPQNVQQPVAPQAPPQGDQQPTQMSQLTGSDISWPNPMEINFIRKIIPNDVATIRCKISSPLGKIVQVPSALIDSGANCSVLSKGLIKLLGTEIDKNKKPPVKWRNNSLESIGSSYNISVTVGQDDNSCTISEDFPVMDDDKPWILLGTPWLDRAGWEPIAKREFKLLHKGKVITIPLSVHKSQREIFKPEVNCTQSGSSDKLKKN